MGPRLGNMGISGTVILKPGIAWECLGGLITLTAIS